MERACENCATTDDELVLVQRLYPGGIDGDSLIDADGPAELWCFSCASQYPNRPEED